MNNAYRQPSTVEDFAQHLRRDVCTIQFGVEQSVGEEVAQLGRVQAGSIDVLKYTGHGRQWACRRGDHIRSRGSDHYLICLPVSAFLELRQGGSAQVLQPGYGAFLDMSRPFWGQIRPIAGSSCFSALHARIPGGLLRRALPAATTLCNSPLELRRGSGNLMRTLLEAALADGPHLSSPQNVRLGNLLFDAICEVAAAVAGEPARHGCGRRGGKSYAYERARQFIQARLSDPQLDTRHVAEYCGVSVRYLQTAFEADAATVGGSIRESRLVACHAALRDPASRGRSVTEIALAWGFRDLSHFCHAYKARFGKTPREERSTVAREPAITASAA